MPKKLRSVPVICESICSNYEELTKRAEAAEATLRDLATLCHEGGLHGYKDDFAFHSKLREITLPYWDRKL